MTEKRKPGENGKTKDSKSTVNQDADHPKLPDEAQMVLTIGMQTGEITKAEWLAETGERTELSDEELLMLDASLSHYHQGAEVTLATVYEENPTVYEIAYAQGMIDYEVGLLEQQNYTPEELAYYQGAADYARLL